jgi:hypothetical protein
VIIRALGLAAAAFLIAACGSKAPNGPCDVDPPDPACMQACDPQPGAPNSCPVGFHCSPDGLCTAQCTPGGDECGSGNACTNDGHCVPVDGDGNLGPDADCPDVSFTAMRVTPTIQLLIDKSGSMTSSFGGSTRWQSVKDALIGPGGVVETYQAAAYFGATLYSASSTANCPVTPTSAGGRQLNNLGPIATLLNGNNPGGNTPTGDSLMVTWQEMVANPPPANSPPIIVLATDGEPQTCVDFSDQTGGRALTVAQAQNAFNAGIRTFILSVGTAVANQHLQQVANAGVGMDPVTGTAPYYVADNPAQLAMAFDAIIGGVISCDLMLDGDITPAQAAAGYVTLNGMVLVYGTDWTLVGSNIIRLMGSACATLQGSSMPTVAGTFPCGGIIE